jgi:hypothetical protein
VTKEVIENAKDVVGEEYSENEWQTMRLLTQLYENEDDPNVIYM